MGKALKTAGAIIGGAVLMATGVGALAGLQVTAMGIAGLGTMSVASLQLTSAGLMAAGAMLDKPKSTASGSPSDWTSNPDQGIPFLFGRMGVAGKIVHRDEYGPDNRLQGIVTIYSGAGPVKSFQGFTADELPVSFVSNGGTAVGKYSRQMWRSWRMGAQPDTALSLPTGLDGGAVMPMWGPLYKLSGKACDLLTLQQDSKFSVYPSGEPQPMQVLEGVYGYDPRYDDTYPGGAGPCRYGVRSTYRYIDNAIIAALNWALGMIENGQVVGGIGASLQGVDLPAFVEAANIADANAWTVAAWPDTSEDASVVLDELLEAGGAKRSRVAGKISCVSRGAPRPSIVTITRRDTAGAIELDTGASRFNRLNTITPVIMSEAHKWKHAPMNPVAFAPLVAEDGGKRSDQIKYRFVSKVKQGAELAAYDILDAREPFSGTIPLLPHLRRLKPGDCFDIDEPGFMLDGVKMLVLSRSYDARVGEVRIAFRSETDSKHPLALGKTTTMPEYPGLTVPDPTKVTGPLPGDWTIVPRPPGESGVQVPIIDIIGGVSNGTATAVHFEWWVVPAGVDPNTSPPLDAAWQSAGIWPPTVTSIPVQADPGTSIWIAASYLRGENFSERRFYGPITVPGLVSDDTTHLKGEPVQDVLDRLTDTATLADQNRQAVEALEEVYGDTASAASSAAAAAASEAAATQAKADALIAKAGAESSAGAAQTARTQAETARAGAETAQTSAANSATTATGAASTATTQAGIATTAKNDAQAASNAAVTARNQASSFADAAGVSAGASAASSVTATAARDSAVGAAIASIPDTISSEMWASPISSNGAPNARPNAPSSWFSSGFYVPPAANTQTGGPKQRVRWADGRVIEVRMVVATPTGTPPARARAAFNRSDNDHQTLGGDYGPTFLVAAGTEQTVIGRFSMGVAAPGATQITRAGAEWISFGGQVNVNAAASGGEPSAVQQIRALTIRDVTSQVGAEGSASAAATSASSAAASETAAGQAASAAATSKTQAETARGQAQTAATQAASSRDDAAGSAASAGSSATNAANSRDAAAGSASAAAGSASTATTKATEAGNSASAAQASQVAATAAKDAAETARGQAQSSASAAATSASSAAASETAAGQSASAASGSATTAATRAGEALTYRNQASSASADAIAASVSAGTSASAAQDAANRLIPERVSNPTDFITDSVSGAPETATVLTQGSNTTTSEQGTVRQFTGSRPVANRGALKIESGRAYRAKTVSRIITGATGNVVRNGFVLYNASWTPIYNVFNLPVRASATGWIEDVSARTGAELLALAPTAVYVRAALHSGVDGSGAALPGVVWQAASVRLEDVTESASAASSAATAIAQSSSASASAAAAQISANIAAQVGGGSLNQNPTFTAWSGALPESYGALSAANGTYTKVSGRNGQPNALRTASVGAADFGFNQFVEGAKAGGEWVVLEVDAVLEAGSFAGAGVQLQARSATAPLVTRSYSFVTEFGAGTSGRAYRFSRLVDLRHANAVRYAINAWTRSSGFAPSSAATLDWQRVSIRPATEGEIAAGTVLPEVEGRLAIVAEVAADVAEQIGSARFRVTGDGGAEPFDISLEAGPDGSAASLTAKAIRLRNIINGQAINVVEVVGGKARFSGDVEVDGNLVLAGTLNGRRVMVPDTVTPMAATYAAGSVGLNGTTATQVQEVWVTTQGGPVVVEFNGLINMRHDPAGSFDAVMEVRRSPNAGTGIQMLYMSVPALGGGNDSVLGMYPLKLIDRPAAGTWRYFVTVWSTANNMTIQEVRQRFMSALEYRTNS